LPPWLRVVAEINPLTYGIDAARSLTLGQPAATAVLAALVASTASAAICMAIAVRGFRRPL
jgi:ABC-2 type transport system permease protein